MKNGMTTLAAGMISLIALSAPAQDWPQWRGANRDAKAADFKAPKTWPKELTKKWKVTVGEGVATPALVGDKLYVFSRQEGNEILRCLNTGDGNEIWQDKYESLGATGPAGGFSGPRSSPTVADGKAVTIGVRGMLSCLDAAKGTKLWRKDEFKAWPNFHPSSSPLILDGMVVAQLGGAENGAVVAYDLGSGDEKWKWSGDSPAYASLSLMSVGGTKLIIAETLRRIVALTAADGKLVWETPYTTPGRPPYNASTPVVDGQTLIFAGSGRGTKAVKIEKEGDKFVGKELWSNPEKSVQFNTPLLKDSFVYGLAQNNELFCINAQDGKTAWSAPGPGGIMGPGRGPGGPGGPGGSGGPPRQGASLPITPIFALITADPPPPGAPPPGGPGGRPRGRMGGGGMGGGAGYGSIVDAGSVLVALTPSAQLVVFEPNGKEYKQLASYKVADGGTHAYPVLSGNRIFIKDRDSVTLWTVE